MVPGHATADPGVALDVRPEIEAADLVQLQDRPEGKGSIFLYSY